MAHHGVVLLPPTMLKRGAKAQQQQPLPLVEWRCRCTLRSCDDQIPSPAFLLSPPPHTPPWQLTARGAPIQADTTPTRARQARSEEPRKGQTQILISSAAGPTTPGVTDPGPPPPGGVGPTCLTFSPPLSPLLPLCWDNRQCLSAEAINAISLFIFFIFSFFYLGVWWWWLALGSGTCCWWYLARVLASSSGGCEIRLARWLAGLAIIRGESGYIGREIHESSRSRLPGFSAIKCSLIICALVNHLSVVQACLISLIYVQ